MQKDFKKGKVIKKHSYRNYKLHEHKTYGNDPLPLIRYHGGQKIVEQYLCSAEIKRRKVSIWESIYIQ